MATVGVQSFTTGILDDDGNLVKDAKNGLSTTGLFTADAKTSMGVTQANITGLTATMQKIWGSNQVTDNSIGNPQPQAVLSTNNLPHDILNRLVGREKGENGDYTSYTKAIPDAALIITMQEVSNLKPIHIVFFHGNYTPGEINAQTNNNNEQRTLDQLTFSANTRNSDGANYKIYYESEDSFDYDTMLKEAFPGYSDTETNPEPEPEPTPKTVKITPENVTVEAGKLADIGVAVTGLDNKTLVFKSDDDAIATAALDTEVGKYQVTGVAAGTTDITATAEADATVTATIHVTVTEPATDPEKVDG
jgi:Bacterial Ig-like domain (group 2)./Phage major tail protein.